ncbi:Magnesium transporter protein 1 [Smittium mucronatum]|uniref:Magnesium transporter protein 1 n=1 Tax=Smittium mucronatum TaxID=133383 RepID=A0A1R0GRV6_9FUNG|nr:Magnesium transporter protein 1 [Smittium mucronatum]
MQKLRDSDQFGFPEINEQDFIDLVQSPNDFNLVILLTTLDESLGCSRCQEIQPEINAISNYWKTSENKDDLFFVYVEAKNSIEVFRKLQISDPPRLLSFPSKTKTKNENMKPGEMRLTSGSDAVKISKALNQALGYEFGISRPFDYLDFAYKGLQVIMGAAFLYLAFTNISLVKDMVKNLFLAGIMMFVVSMNSGYVWTHIKNPPYMNGGGSNKYFAPGMQDQLGVETLIISSLYGTCATIVIFMIKRVPKIKNEYVQSAVMIVAMIALVVAASYVFSDYAIKNSGYPFRILIK